MITEQDVLSTKSVADLRQLQNDDLSNRSMTAAEFTHILELCDGYWKHSGDMRAPHAELVSHGGKPGNHSNGFVNALAALRYTNLCTIIAQQLVLKLRNGASGGRKNPYWDWIDWVVGSDHAGATFSHEVARIYNAQHDFTEKQADNTQAWKRFTIGPKELVLQIEELSTDLKTPMAVRTGIRAAHSYPILFVPVCGLFVHRGNTYSFDGATVISLVHYDIDVWSPEECPLCAQGSRAIKPKKNWAELTGRP